MECKHQIAQQGGIVSQIRDLVDAMKINVGMLTDEIVRKQTSIDILNE